MSVDKSVQFPGLVSHSSANELFHETLRLFVSDEGDRRYTVKQLSKGTRIHPRIIQSFLVDPNGEYGENYRCPRIEHLLTLMKFLGPEFTSEILSVVGFCAFEAPEPDEPDTSRLALEAVQDAAELSTIAADGDNVSRLRSLGTRMMMRGANVREAALKDQPSLFALRRVG